MDSTALGVFVMMLVAAALFVASVLLFAQSQGWFRTEWRLPAVRSRRGRLSPPVPAALFSLRGVCKAYREPSGKAVVVLDGVNLDFHPGVTGLLGPSGQGKSTLLNLLGGLDVPDRGVVRFRGWPLPGVENAVLRGHRAKRISFMFQDCNLISHLTVEENAALPLLCRGVRRHDALELARRNLRLVGLHEVLRRRPAQLSGGQRQRVAVARAFTSEADVILADEPTGALDPGTAEPVMQLFSRLARLSGRPVILVTHNEDLALRYCDHLLRWTDKGIEDVTPAEKALPLVSLGEFI
jgi:ABC-type lipoprotein export system ATPase subunit